MRGFDDSVKRTAEAILRDGQELLPVVISINEWGSMTAYMMVVPKHQWKRFIQMVIEKDNPEAIAFVSSVHHRTYEKGESIEQRPRDDPKATEGAICHISEKGGNLRTWLIDYCLGFKGQPLNIGKWAQLEGVEYDGILNGIWSPLNHE